MTRVANKKLVGGIGVNDADYVVSHTTNGERVVCPFYRVWSNMLIRCNKKKFQQLHPTYIDCTVADEWLIFSVFRSWLITKDWEGKSLDKDILIQGNKFYSPLTCIFVSDSINKLLLIKGAKRGEQPLGVTYYKPYGKYLSRCSVYGKIKHIGYYDLQSQASEAYKEVKYKHIAEIANQQSEPLRTALLNYVIEG